VVVTALVAPLVFLIAFLFHHQNAYGASYVHCDAFHVLYRVYADVFRDQDGVFLVLFLYALDVSCVFHQKSYLQNH
jgi:hypothetical protein